MELLHKGFDAIDIAYPAHLPEILIAKLSNAKDLALASNAPTQVLLNGLPFNVALTGARGGYAFRCDTGPLGEVWFFKLPNKRDPWGIRVSVAAVQVALRGLHGVRDHLENKLAALGVPLLPGTESIARIDFALDFLAPNFVLSTDQFVMSQRFSRMRHGDLLTYKEGGQTGRTTSVTIGKNPGRQVIVYDKRAEILAKKKLYWPEIWNTKRRRAGLPELDMSDADTSRVWRVELRAYKRHLKDDWGVSSWGQLQQKLPTIFGTLLEDVRYCQPNGDSNRSRWPTHRLWNRVAQELRDDLSNLQSFASEERILELQRAELMQMIRSQIAGCLLTLLALNRVDPKNLSEFVAQESRALSDRFREHPEKTQAKLAKAMARYP
ncbi:MULTISPECIES: hypothetical protein [unclassified Hyphomonas]|uniref:hypothetical protein n=1 Tax=unclassified Hyphomonas TaxID=2630699 RepID=UPI0025C1EE9B|nr:MULTISPECIES: hypothetical protein [unclassified Hyphomonas]